MSKYTKLKEKELPTMVSSKGQKLITESGTVFLEAGDSFKLIPISEQTAETEKMANAVLTAVNNELKDEIIEVKLVSDTSSNMNGVKTTSLTFEVVVPEENQSEMLKQDVAGIEFTPEFDAMLNDVLINKVGCKAEDLSSDNMSNTFSINKVEVEDMLEVEVVEPTVELFSGNDDYIEMPIDSMLDAPILDMVEPLEDEMYYESAKKESKFVKFVEKSCKEEDEKSDDKEKEDMKEASKDNQWYASMNIDNTFELYKDAMKAKDAKDLEKKMLAKKSKFPDAKKIDFKNIDWKKILTDLNESTDKKDSKEDEKEDMEEGMPPTDENGKFIKAKDADKKDKEDDDKKDDKKKKESVKYNPVKVDKYRL